MNIRRLTAVAALALALPGAAFAMDLAELVGKALDAQGGAAALQAVKSQKGTGKIVTQGMEMPFTMVSARPNRMRVDVSVMGMSIVQAFDGASGWSINPMTGSQDAQPMSDVETKGFKLQADMDGPLLNWEARGWTGEYIGQEDIEGTAAYRLRIDTKQDVVMDLWYDAESFLMLKQNTKMKIDQGEFETQMYPTDYRQVNGMTLPFALETRRGDVTMMNMVFDSLEFGVPVEDASFTMPAKAVPAAAEGGAGK